MSATGGGGRTLTITLPIPDHRLTANGRLGWRAKARLVREHRAWAAGEAANAVNRSGATSRPFFPPGTPVRVTVQVKRKKGGKRWDNQAVIESLKPAADGMEGHIFDNDKCLQWGEVEWDAKPDGAGQVILTLTGEEQP